jgi:hypothetical protein
MAIRLKNKNPKRDLVIIGKMGILTSCIADLENKYEAKQKQWYRD